MSPTRNSHVSVCLLSLVCLSSASCCFGFGTFGFDIHHRYSDSVKKILDVDDLPEKGSYRYYSDLAGRDRLLHGRRLATENDQTPVTFESGNDTYRLNALGFLHYANVTVGTPGLSFLVALDTGSDLFWLPCDCTSCVHGLNSSAGVIDFNIYSPNTSSTSSKITCNSTLCELQNRCSSANSDCPYQVRYLSDGTTSTGYLVEDVLHLITNNNNSKAVDARISFGCGKVQTGSFLDGAAPNGLFGLGMDKTSVPSILAKQGITSNSFSMCFGSDGMGRISFGDTGSSDQEETPFYLRQSHPTYNITVTQTSVGGSAANLEFSAIFDSGTSFTYLNDPAYTQISESFNSMAQEQRLQNDSDLPFDYCYLLSSNQTSFKYPVVNLTMKGGHQYLVNDPIVVVSSQDANLYCLAIVKSDNVNIIGQNFMTGYHIVFNREKNVLGWKPSNCYGTDNSNTLPVKPPTASSPIPPATAVNPEAKAGNPNNSPLSGAPPPMGNHSPKLRHLSYALAVILIPFLAMV
ncbi:hypothetical protein ACOSP7_022604 [Xanthoceras sorbifolium]|uniref:Peptidase A1 domain-containing protein n=1 Tax=Xanthoceras sorbifolium TaxID=99658 RepID=A0ABQ8HPE5_9ROSI|nr:hypothetical protein JRO89_XS08G0121000 [Xanthoceras sorbifolium]